MPDTIQYLTEITLDINTNRTFPVVSAKQNDTGRKIKITIQKNGIDYPIASGHSVVFRCSKPDGYAVLDWAERNDDGTVTVTLTAQALATAGRAYADVVEFNNDLHSIIDASEMNNAVRLSTVCFILNIVAEPDVASNISTNEFEVFEDCIDNILDGIDKVFWAEDGVTTNAEIEAAYQAGKMVCVKRGIYIFVMFQRNSATRHLFSSISGYLVRYFAVDTNVWETTAYYTLARTSELPTQASDIGAIPAPASPSDGDVLTYDSNDDEWVAQAPATEVFWATYGTTTSAELEAAYQAGKIVLVTKSSNTYILDYRAGAASHSFHSLWGNYRVYYLKCENNSWSNPVYMDVPAPATATPQPLGTAAVGSSTKYAKEDHVHKKPSKSDIGLGNVDNVQQYSASNPPPYPVTSVNGSTGAVTLNIPASASDVGAVAVEQGVGHSGEFLVVGSDGNVTTVTLSTWQGGSY